MTLAELSRRLGGAPSISQLARIELGQQQANIDLMLQLSRIYGVPITELLDDDGDIGRQVYVRAAIGGEPTTRSICVPRDSAGELVGIELCDRSADYLYAPGTILICRPADDWDGTIVGRRVVARPDGLPVRLVLREAVQDADGIIWLISRTSQPSGSAPIRAEDAQILYIVKASYRPE